MSVRKWYRENSLSIIFFAIFVATFAGHLVSGRLEYNENQSMHGAASVSLGEYARSGHFLESVFENWESEFLQMAAFVVFTIFLRQKGSSESKHVAEREEVDQDPRRSRSRRSSWPVRRGGWALRLYENSLTIALVFLFVLSFTLHAVHGFRVQAEEALEHGASPDPSVLAYAGSAKFWFESFQNWQSEFLSVAVLVVLSIFLRQRGSSQSKPVAAPDSETGV